MPRPAPAATRALAILDLLAGRPTESFTLSDIAREVGINLASAHAILGAMVDSGYLLRHPSQKTYVLGPAVVAIGNAALDRHPVIAAAREEMTRLASELDLECMATVPFGNELVVVGRAGPPHPHRPLIFVGQRTPLVPPLGIMYLAWSTAEDIDQWLHNLGPDIAADAADRHLAALAGARVLGYNVHAAYRDDGTVEPVRVVGRPPRLDLGRRRYRVTSIAAPAFDAYGRVAVVLNLDGFREPLTRNEATAYGERLRDTGLRVTRLSGGVPPDESNAVAL